MALLAKVDRMRNSYTAWMNVIFLFTSLDIFLLSFQIITVKTFHSSTSDFIFDASYKWINAFPSFLPISSWGLNRDPQDELVAKIITIFIQEWWGQKCFICCCHFPRWALEYCGSAGKMTGYSKFPLFLHCLLSLALSHTCLLEPCQVALVEEIHKHGKAATWC